MLFRCEQDDVQVRGDVFVARVFDNEADFKRLDFNLSEISSSADWIRQAAAQNEKKRKVRHPFFWRQTCQWIPSTL